MPKRRLPVFGERRHHTLPERYNPTSRNAYHDFSFSGVRHMRTVPQWTTHPFLTNRRYVVEVLESQTDDVIGSPHSLTVASQVQDDESSFRDSHVVVYVRTLGSFPTMFNAYTRHGIAQCLLLLQVPHCALLVNDVVRVVR